MKKIKCLIPLFGLSTIACMAMPITSCKSNDKEEESGTSGTITTSGTYSNKTYNATTAKKNALLVNGSNIEVNVNDSTITKSGDSDGGDDDSFYGYNSALLNKGGAKLTLSNVTVNSTAKGGNGIFCYGGASNGSGDGSTITANSCKVTTTKDNAGGYMTTGKGISYINNCSATTAGTSSAAIRTDRGGGTVVVDGGTYKTTGAGSPTIYSTADISVKNANLTATTSEGAIIEGKNSITLENCTLEDTNSKLNGQSTTYKNVFLYQSMSGDASVGTSEFNATGSTITTHKGDDFYVTNTTAVINLTNNVITNDWTATSEVPHYFLRAQKDSWGKSGSNGGLVTLNAINQTMKGDIYVDSISTLTMTMSYGSKFTGAINSAKSTKGCSLEIKDTNSTMVLTGDCYLTSFTNADATNSNIDNTNGHIKVWNGSSWEQVW